MRGDGKHLFILERISIQNKWKDFTQLWLSVSVVLPELLTGVEVRYYLQENGCVKARFVQEKLIPAWVMTHKSWMLGAPCMICKQLGRLDEIFHPYQLLMFVQPWGRSNVNLVVSGVSWNLYVSFTFWALKNLLRHKISIEGKYLYNSFRAMMWLATTHTSFIRGTYHYLWAF